MDSNATRFSKRSRAARLRVTLVSFFDPIHSNRISQGSVQADVCFRAPGKERSGLGIVPPRQDWAEQIGERCRKSR